MANSTFLDLPIVVTPDGTETLAVVVPPSSTTGVSKRMTSAQIAGLAAHLPTTSLATLSVFGNPSPNAAATGTSIPGIAGQVLVINDAGTAVVFGQVNLSNAASVTGIVSVPLGGSGTGTLTANAVLYGNGTSSLSVTNTTANGVLSSNASSVPSFITGQSNQVLVIAAGGTTVAFGQVNLSATAAITGSLNITAFLTGIVTVPLGGTGTSALTANAVLYGNGTSTVALSNTTANGVLTTNASSVPAFALTLPSAVQANITQVNTLTTGTWNASVISVTWGGSGTSSLTSNAVLLGNGTAAVGSVANATSGFVLGANGTSSAPTFLQFNLSNATGAISTTGLPTISALSAVANSSSASAQAAAVAGTTDQVLRIAATGTSLGFGQVNLSAAAAVTGRLSFSNITTIAGLSLLGVTGTVSNTVAAITGTTDQVAIINHGGTGLVFGQVNLATSAAVTGNLPVTQGGTGANTSATAVTNIGALSSSATGQAMTAGFLPAAFNLGTASGTLTINCGNGPLQRLISNSTFTLAAPSNDGEADILVTNAGSASTITISGFSVGANTGDTYATTSGAKFIFMSRTINGSSTYAWKALQ